MTEISKAIEFLQDLQILSMVKGARTPIGKRYSYVRKPPHTKKRTEEVNKLMVEKGYKLVLDYEDYIKTYELAKHRYSPLEDIDNILLIEPLYQSIKETFSVLNLTFPENVVIGTSQLGQINAMAAAPLEGSDIKIILLDDGLFIFLNGMAKIISMLFPRRDEGNNMFSIGFDPDDIDKILSSNNSVHEHFIDLITAYLITGHSYNSRRFLLDADYNSFASMLRDTAELFILAHEYGHIVAGHFSDSPNEKMIVEGEVLRGWRLNYAKEFQADFFANVIVMRYNHQLCDMTAELSFAGVQFFFASMEMLMLALGNDFSTTHPQPEARLRALEKSLYNDTPDKELVRDVEQFGNALFYAIFKLWGMNADILQNKIIQAKGDASQTDI